MQRSQYYHYPKSQLSQSKDAKIAGGGSLRASMQQYHIGNKGEAPYNGPAQRPAAASGPVSASAGSSQRHKSKPNANSQADFRRTSKNTKITNNSTKQIFRIADF